MHLTRDIGTNAAAIMWGMKNRDLTECECGVVEQYAAIGEAADFLTQHEAAIGDLLEGGFPGVFAYEVAEELGGWMHESTAPEHPIEFSADEKNKCAGLLAEFFLGSISEEGEPIRESRRSDYAATLSYLADNFPEHDWADWHARMDVKPPREVETRFEFAPAVVQWVVGDTAYLRDGVHVRKGEIKRIICVQSLDTTGKLDTVTNIEVQWQGVINTVMLPSNEVAKLKRTAEEAFA